MIEKRADYLFIDAQPLNTPNFSDSFIKDQGLKVDPAVYANTISGIKTASAAKESSEKSGDGMDSPVFDLEAEISSHPDSLFIKCFAIKADETNDNGDYFSQDELRKAVPTFIGVPLFTNHANSDINEARGKVVHSWWDEEKNGIMIVGRVDAAAYPQLARGIKEEYVVGTSMGCQVQHSICSVCHNYAETPDQYCSCIQERKTREVTSRQQECKYHDQGPEKQCPVCACKKGESKKYAVRTKVFEYNYGIKFIENSFVVNPACHDCGVTEVIDPQRFRTKVAEIEKSLPRLLKAIKDEPLACTDQTCIKIAGQQEIDNLNQALDLISSVSQTMLTQKEQIDLEFLSDLVKVLSDLQTVVDELSEQGYGRLESPGGEQQDGQPGEPQMGDQGPPGEITNSVQPMNPTPGGGSKIHSGPAGSAGSVTGPLANVKKLQLEKLANKLIDRSKKLVIPEFHINESKADATVKIASIVSKKQLSIPLHILKSKLRSH
jgi:hypothetical protein